MPFARPRASGAITTRGSQQLMQGGYGVSRERHHGHVPALALSFARYLVTVATAGGCLSGA